MVSLTNHPGSVKERRQYLHRVIDEANEPLVVVLMRFFDYWEKKDKEWGGQKMEIARTYEHQVESQGQK